jgi:hypothetical protein
MSLVENHTHPHTVSPWGEILKWLSKEYHRKKKTEKKKQLITEEQRIFYFIVLNRNFEE